MSHEHLVVPRIEGTVYRWRVGEGTDRLELVVDAALGARITRFSLAGRDVLTGADVNDLNFGATFWTSPQAAWGWPPPVEHDSEPYAAHQAGEDGAAGVFTGKPDAKLGLAETKTYFVDAASGAETNEYGLHNHGGDPRPWGVALSPSAPPHGRTVLLSGGRGDRAGVDAGREDGGGRGLVRLRRARHRRSPEAVRARQRGVDRPRRPRARAAAGEELPRDHAGAAGPRRGGAGALRRSEAHVHRGRAAGRVPVPGPRRDRHLARHLVAAPRAPRRGDSPGQHGASDRGARAGLVLVRPGGDFPARGEGESDGR